MENAWGTDWCGSLLKLIKSKKIKIYRDTFLALINILDPEGIEERSKYRLKRRLYNTPGPNFLWHIDGYNKLKPYGFSIHGGIDGCSRYVFWLKLATTNKNPDVISQFYLETIKEKQFVNCIVRCDKGTENVGVVALQQVLRRNHEDKFFSSQSVIQSKSTHNPRIESF